MFCFLKMSSIVKLITRGFVSMRSYSLVRRMPPILQIGVKSGLLMSYAQNNPNEIQVSKSQQIEIPSLGSVTHEALIKQACAASLETSSQLLIFTVNAFIEVSSRYRTAIQRHISLMTDLMDPNISEYYKQQLWDGVVDARNESQELRNSLMELSSLLDCVMKLATASAEVSYLAGAEFISTNMCERLNTVNKEFQKECISNKMAEDDCLKLQAQFAEHSPEQTNVPES